MVPGSPGGFQPPKGTRFPRQARVTRGKEIREVLSQGQRFRTPLLDVFVLDSGRSRPRVGFIVPKSGRSSVERNRLKRRLKEIGRTMVLGALFDRGPSADVLVRTRPQAYEASWDELGATVTGVVEGLCSQDC